ncbi:hypothetical protein Tco_1233295 [Tanacetum coccineum]
MKIEGAMGKKDELPDFLIYGTNLTFVDLSETSFYGMELRGQKPVYVNCVLDNIGDEGVVLVLPTPKDDGRILVLFENDEDGVDVNPYTINYGCGPVELNSVSLNPQDMHKCSDQIYFSSPALTKDIQDMQIKMTTEKT